MKTFILINGTTAHIIQRASKQRAIDTAINISDHSQEIIVREVKSLTK